MSMSKHKYDWVRNLPYNVKCKSLDIIEIGASITCLYYNRDNDRSTSFKEKILQIKMTGIFVSLMRASGE